ncbi:penicillin acylase family protein [Opitutus sp. ER46]|uniref:penicillin acylase family protein n=1 Tax=Opitutus sp. ER46 TaxID=2161864 RepID=UPI000D31CA09|nr:penicillin acylase family protein [Opitutus sp. ER46]PTX91431.1 penicillin acylase family protein [Opitutus sp. ER46]
MKPALSKRLRLLASAVSVLVLLAVIAVAWVYSRIQRSLPQLDGSAAVPGLTAAVSVERDALGVPTIRGQTRADVARALGFVHAQDRFFQMDVWRRLAAGELSELFGERTLPTDKAMRQHGFRRLTRQTVAALPPEHRALLEAYAEGVNAGLAALREPPFEYVISRATPAPWRPEDTMLVNAAMIIDLQDGTGRYERTLMTLRNVMGASGLAFFAPLQTSADAALDGSRGAVAPIPGPHVVDVRGKSITQLALPAPAALAATNRHAGEPFDLLARDPEQKQGSNALALAGTHTANGAALLASDMHLTLSVPNTWYRASFEFGGRKITGVTLPGTPLMIAGSNGRVAWSFTNAYADTGDIIVVDTNAVHPRLYRAPGHADLLEIESREETIAVKGAKTEKVTIDWTIWGPVVDHDDTGRPLVYLWTGHDPAAMNLDLLLMEDATDVSAAVAIAHRAGLPPQNLVAADAAGDIAWTIAGRLPRRAGYDGRLPVSFQYGDRSWEGYTPADQIPVITSRLTGHGAEQAAPDGRIWSGNQRMLGGDALKVLGDAAYARPARAAQLRDDLARLQQATPRDLLAIQLDDRALFLERWHKLLMATLTPAAIAEKDVRGALRGYAEKWEGRASVDAISYSIVRLFRVAVYTHVFTPAFAACTSANKDFRWNSLLLEDAVWRILEEKPAHLLDPKYPSWDALLVAAVDDTITELNRAEVRLPHATWGLRNRAEIRHPFSYTLPWFLRSKLDMPADPQPGDIDMPRVQRPKHGASERFVVAPGHEAEGIFHMPCGQSGHPLSPFYRAGHEAWARGEPTPFLPGPTAHTLTLTPP